MINITADYVRGYFDGEGGVYPKYHTIDITNTNLSILQNIQLYLDTCKIHSSLRKHTSRKTQCYRLVITGKHNIFLFKKMIGSFDEPRLHKLDLLFKNYKYYTLSPEDKIKIKKLRDDGLTFKQISEQTKIKENTIWAFINKEQKNEQLD